LQDFLLGELIEVAGYKYFNLIFLRALIIKKTRMRIIINTF